MSDRSEQASWVEVRVHGVTGTPPEDALGSAFVTQIAGSDRGRVYARANALGNSKPASGGHWLEACQWGEPGPGSWRQGLWFLLIPFALVNAASFMLPRTEHRLGRLLRGVAEAMLRLVGLCLSGAVAFTIGYVLIDLVGGQWAPLRVGVPDTTGLVLIAFAVAVATTELVHLLPERGGDVRSAGDAVQPGATPAVRGDAHHETRLSDRRFFDGDADAPRLRALHRSAGVLVVTLLLARSVIGESGLVLAIGLALLAVAGSVVLLGDRHRPGRSRPSRWQRLLLSRFRHLPVLAAYLLALATGLQVARASVDGPLDQPDQLAAVDAVALTLLSWTVAALVLLLAACSGLALATRRRWAKPAAFRPYAFGTGAYWAASAGVFLGVGYCAAVATVVSYALTDTTSSPVLERVVYAWGVAALLIMAVGAVMGLRLLLTWRGQRRRVAAMYALVEPARGLPSSWLRRLGFTVALSRMKNLLAPVMVVAGLAALVLAAFAGREICGSRLVGTLALSQRCTPDSEVRLRGMFDLVSNDAVGKLAWLVPAGTAALLVLAAVLVLLGRTASRLSGTRRAVDMVWDVLAFWPRASQPLVPAAYARLAVPELVERIRYHLDRFPHRRLVLAGHGQGSLIAFAAVLWLTPEQLSRVGLVTHGSQLQTSLSRAFPAYVNIDAVQAVMNDLDGRWINLYRETDTLAGPVLSWSHCDLAQPSSVSMSTSWDWRERSPAGDTMHADTGRRECLRDWRLLDPLPVGRDRQQEPLRRARGHDDYYADPAWDAAVARVRGRVPTPAARR